MSVSRRVRQALAAFAAIAATVVLSWGLATAPAAAEDPSTGTLDTSVTSVQTAQGETKGDECTGDKCKKINWCDYRPNGQAPVGLASDAPMVLLGNEKDGTPSCVKKPKVEYKCCVADQSGKADISVKVTNYNSFKMKVRVWVDSGTPVSKWVDGNSSATYNFSGIANGDHVIHASVWAGGETWCKFKDKEVTVKCASPSPSTSASPSASVSPSVSTSPSTTPGGQLPQTGAPVGLIATGGILTAAAGAGLLLIARRRRDSEFTDTTVES